jgi:hypothetical protein
MSAERRLRRAQQGGSGPEGLMEWIKGAVPYWQAAYRAALKAGYPTDLILTATPYDDRADVPPDQILALRRTNRGWLTSRVPKLRGDFNKPCPAGMFYVCATKSGGRLGGSYVGMLSASTGHDALPDPPFVEGRAVFSVRDCPPLPCPDPRNPVVYQDAPGFPGCKVGSDLPSS